MDRTWIARTAVSGAAALMALAIEGAAPPTSAAAAGPVATASTGGIPLNVRTGPARSYPRAATIPDGARLSIVCRVFGQLVTGHVRRTVVWNRLSNGRFVSDSNVSWRPARPTLPACRTRPSAAGVRPAARPAPLAAASTGGVPLNARTGASRAHERVGTIPDGSRLSIVCRVFGQLVTGHVRRTVVWDRLSDGRFVSDSNVSWRPARPTLPSCRTAPDAVPADPAGFIARMAGPARQSMARDRVPASVTIAQAIIESGWGHSRLSADDHNYFGIKCFGTPGPIAVGCRTYATSECERSHCFRTEATFRTYRDYRDSVRDHGRFLVVNPRYRPAFAYTRDANRFVVEIHKAGYATAPGYAKAVIALMQQHNLYRFDR